MECNQDLGFESLGVIDSSLIQKKARNRIQRMVGLDLDQLPKFKEFELCF